MISSRKAAAVVSCLVAHIALAHALAFVGPGPLAPSGSTQHRLWRSARSTIAPHQSWCSRITEDAINVDWARPNAEGGFGRVYFGHDVESRQRVVVKVPFVWGERAWGVERHINSKLKKRAGPDGPWAEYLGCCDLLRNKNVGTLDRSLIPASLAWKRVEGRTLREYLDKSLDLQGALGVRDTTRSIRPFLCEKVLGELLLAIATLHRIGIIHRDVKPDNVLLCPKSPGDSSGGVAFKLIDFGSGLDLRSPLKVGWRLSALDPAYAPPEVLVDWLFPRRYDVFAAAMTALRVLCPSLGTNSRGQEMFYEFSKKELPQYRFDLRRVCEAKAGQYEPLALEMRALADGNHDRLLDTLAALLRRDPSSRPTAEQALLMLGGRWAERVTALPAGTPVVATCQLLGAVALCWPLSAFEVLKASLALTWRSIVFFFTQVRATVSGPLAGSRQPESIRGHSRHHVMVAAVRRWLRASRLRRRLRLSLPTLRALAPRWPWRQLERDQAREDMPAANLKSELPKDGAGGRRVGPRPGTGRAWLQKPLARSSMAVHRRSK